MAVDLTHPVYEPAGVAADHACEPSGGQPFTAGPAAAARQHRRLFAVSQAITWGAVALVFTGGSVSRGRVPAETSWLVSTNVACGLVLSTLMAIVLTRLRSRTQRLMRLILLCPVAAALAATAHGLVAGIPAMLGFDAWSFSGFAGMTLGGLIRPLALYLLWTSGFLITTLWTERLEARDRLERLEREVRDSELELLQSQLDPHFLFNTLTLLQAEADDPARVQELTLRLSQYLRAAIGVRQRLVPLGEQAEACLAYLELQRARFGPRLSWRLAVDKDAAFAPLPSLSIQTLVENAVRHSLEADGGDSEIVIAAGLDAENVIVDVSHPGSLSPDATGPTQASSDAGGGNQGRGLRNLARRLQLTLGPDAKLMLSSRDGIVHGTISFPAYRCPPEDRAG